MVLGTTCSEIGVQFIASAVPDLGNYLGSYTYLAAEVVWGALAILLLARNNAFRRGARSIAVLYPVGMVWDWYSLEIGLYEVPERTRTGIELLIPLEEHLFLIIVAAFVVGVHETVNQNLEEVQKAEDAEKSQKAEDVEDR